MNIMEWFGKLDVSVQAAIITAGGTVFASLIAGVFTLLAKERKKKTKESPIDSRSLRQCVPMTPKTPVTPVAQSSVCFQDSRMTGTFTFDYSNNDGKYTIGTGEYQFVTRWTKASDVCIHAYKDSLGSNGAIARVKQASTWPEKIGPEMDFSSRARTPDIGDVIIWKNAHGKYAATRILAIMDDTRGADHDELTCEYVIYQ